MTGRNTAALSNELKSRLASLQADFKSVKGTPFNYFFCPILYRDEDIKLCKGHVLNQAFGIGGGKWTVQREDVDNFFGSRFESEITKLRYRNALETADVLGDARLRRELRPRIYAGSREIDHFIPQGEVPEHFTAMHSSDEGLPQLVGLKIHPREVEEAIDADWHIEVALDLRVGALVSLLKAAHLTHFYLFGYEYVFSPTGHLVGSQMLGKLFEAARGLSRAAALSEAKRQLSGCENMVRPFLDTNLDLKGTVLDRQVLVCWSSSGFPWASIVTVPAGESLHSVMLPAGDHAEGIATWDSFMKNDNESIAVKIARFEPKGEQSHWLLSKKTWRVRWPKGATLGIEE